LADIESTVALDISDAIGAIGDLADKITGDLGAAFDLVIEDFQTALGRIDLGELTSGLDQIASTVGDTFGPQLSDSITTSIQEGFAQGGLVGSAALLDTGTQAIDAIAQAATDALPQAFAEAGIVGGAAIVDTGTQAIDALSEEARGEIGGALTDAAKEFGSALSGVDLSGPGSEIQGMTDAVDSLAQATQESSDSADETTQSFGSMASAGQGLGEALQVAQGETGSLTQRLVELAGSAGPVVVGIVAIGAGLGTLASAGLTAVAAEEQMSLAFGKFADQLQHIDVNGLNGDLSELTVKAGGTTAEIEQLLATFGRFLTSGGSTQKQAAGVAEGFAALTDTVAALHPQMGSLTEIGQKLFQALKTGRDTALAPFDLGLTKATITQEAFRLGMIDSIDTALTPYQRVQAGISLALRNNTDLNEKYGKGVELAATKQKALTAALKESFENLGKPFVKPIQEFEQALVPLAEQLGKITAELLSAFLPIVRDLVPVLGAAASAVGGIADALNFLGPIIRPIIEAFVVYKVVTGAATVANTLFSRSVGGIALDLQGIATKFAGASTGIGSFGQVVGRLGVVLPGVATGLAVGVPALDKYGESAGDTAQAVGGFALAGASLGTAILPGVGTAVGAVTGALVGATAGLLSGGKALDDYRQKFQDLAKVLDAQRGKQQLGSFIKQLGIEDIQEFNRGDHVGALRNELLEVAKVSPTAAHQVISDLRNTQGEFHITAAEAKALNDQVTHQAVLNEKAAKNTKENADANKNAGVQFDAAAEKAKDLNKAEADLQKQTDTMVDDFVKGLPGVADAFSAAAADVGIFTKALDDIPTTAFDNLTKAAEHFGQTATPAELERSLQDQLDRVAKFQFQLNILVQSGHEKLATLLAQQGVDAAGGLADQLAQSIVAGQPDLANAIEGTLNQIGEIDQRAADKLSFDKFNEKLFQQTLQTSQLADNLQTLIEAGFAKAIPAIQSLPKELRGAAAAQLTEDLKAGHPELVDQWVNFIALSQAEGDRAADKVREAGKPAIKAFNDIKTEIGAQMISLPAGIVEAGNAALAAAQGAGTGVGESVKTGAAKGVKGTAAEFGKEFGIIPEQINKQAEAAGVAGHNVGDKAKTGVHNAARLIPGEMEATMKNTAKAVTSGTVPSYTAGYDVGRSVSQGIAAGVLKDAKQIADNAALVVLIAKAAAKTAAKIGSPSQVFADEIGAPIAQGIAEGILGGKADIEKALGDVLVPSSPAVQGRVADVTGQATIRAAASGTAPGAGAVAGGTTIAIDKVVLEQASPNPTKEVMAAVKQLRDGATKARLG
jgi:hypothetical protein